MKIEKAIKLDKNYIEEHKIDVSHHLLCNVEYKNLHNEFEKPFWRI